MRLHDLFLLKEYDDLEQEKQGIISAISGLRADNEEDAKHSAGLVCNQGPPPEWFFQEFNANNINAKKDKKKTEAAKN